MSGNDYKSQLAAERIKDQALLVSKGLSRAQAERAAAAAARNVNAYGQKEAGPSRWQERKEAKRQMYLGSTEKPPVVGVKPKASPTSSGGAYCQCQKCFRLGHWTYECKNDHTYISRPSRTHQLKNPKLKKTTVLKSCQFVNPDLEKEREGERKLLIEKIEKGKSERSEAKRRIKVKHVSRSGSDHNSSEASVFNTDTESSSTGSEYSSERVSSSCSSLDSEDKKRRYKRKLKKRRHRKNSTSSARNVNAYGQKEEGPSRWQERKEAKRQMYLGSTEKPPILGVKPNASPTSSGGAYSQCQKCFQLGHWIYECKNDHTYISRPSRTHQLKNPKLKKTTVLKSCQFVNPDLEKEREEERKLLKEKIEKGKSERREAKRRRKHISLSGSDHNSSEASVFNTDTESSSTGSEYSSERGSSSCSSLDSEDKKRRYKGKLKKRRHRTNSTSSASSYSESTSDSDSDVKGGRRKSRRRGNRHRVCEGNEEAKYVDLISSHIKN